ncbi:hypothetical protein E2C01_072528 [Portunus trituberculatus]|jgi:2,3-bisphosphoglycerate-independent phosphoglycerate mutase
MVRR